MSSADLLVPPAYLWVPERAGSLGEDVVGLAVEDIGLPLDPEQALVLDAMFSIDYDGKLAALEFALIAPRQNIKTHVFKAAAWADLLLFDQPLVMWTAHEFNTAMEAFRDMVELVDSSPYLSRRVKRILNANGDEGIELMTGQRLRFKARTKSGARGLTAPRLFLDEGFALQAAHLGSVLPTMAAMSMTGDPQVRYASSAGLVGSEMLRRLRDRGRPGGDPTLIYLEWCAGEKPCKSAECDHHFGIKGCALDDRKLWKAANLALGRRIDIEFIAAMRRSLPPEEFAREFLGWWDEPAAGAAGIPLDQWAALANRKSSIAEPCTLGVDVAYGHTSGAITVCGGPLHVADHQPGTSWIVPSLLAYTKKHDVESIGLDPTSPAGALIPDLERAGFTIRTEKNPTGLIVLLQPSVAARACEAFLAGVLSGEVEHRDQMVLNQAVEHAGRRLSGDTWRWSRLTTPVDITPLTSATWARWLYIQAHGGPPAASASKPADGPKGTDVFRPRQRLKI